MAPALNSLAESGGAELHPFMKPMLPTPAPCPPEGDDWIHEIQLDGRRAQLSLNQSRCRLYSGVGDDWSHHADHILEAAAQLGTTNTVIDGELIVRDQGGRSDGDLLDTVMSHDEDKSSLVFVAFDLLFLEGCDIRTHPLEHRRVALCGLVGTPDIWAPVQLSRDLPTSGSNLLTAAHDTFQKGVISKRRGSPYISGRSFDWKTSTAHR